AQQHVRRQYRPIAVSADHHNFLSAPGGQGRHGLVVIPFTGLFQDTLRFMLAVGKQLRKDWGAKK
ncbi:MAG: hypothetical protein Q7T25_12270, partial [Sideroxyarcus sp.]|nr:hypothetical protein [Sideroxyarcus sp.]